MTTLLIVSVAMIVAPIFMIIGMWAGWFMAMKAVNAKVLELKQSIKNKN